MNSKKAVCFTTEKGAEKGDGNQSSKKRRKNEEDSEEEVSEEEPTHRKGRQSDTRHTRHT